MGTTNTGQTVRYRILCILKEEGIQGWGDIRVNPRLSKFDPDTLQFELSNLVKQWLVLDIGRGYQIAPAGEQYLIKRQAVKQETEGTSE